ncbi:autophagy protein 5 [Rhizophlyctis rosea]|uniref:Autophagy protein 5 n=1 Tax=Rhizophlyctis rosea TaxID=64517 RepID=A0AAD5SL03_9FUNG|nr:autophagy protein 5 [Rhizophlyctis rosea]
MALSKQDQTQLWEGLWANNHNLFWKVNTKLIMNDQAIPKNIPIRIYPEDRPVVQDLVPPLDAETGKDLTVSDILQRLVPDMLPPPPNPSDTNTISPPAPATPVAVLHGIPLPMTAPILWISRHLSYPDNFLHVAVTTAPSGT